MISHTIFCSDICLFKIGSHTDKQASHFFGGELKVVDPFPFGEQKVHTKASRFIQHMELIMTSFGCCLILATVTVFRTESWSLMLQGCTLTSGARGAWLVMIWSISGG